MTTTVGFKVWEEGKRVAIRMARLEKPAEGFCPTCNIKTILEHGRIAEHRSKIQLCPGVGAVVTPLKAAKR